MAHHIWQRDAEGKPKVGIVIKWESKNMSLEFFGIKLAIM